MIDYSERLLNLGRKVALNLVRSVFVNRRKMVLVEAFGKIALNGELKRKAMIEL